ncbi:MAG TPA: hypothetical protein VLQ67_04365, partial [Arachnia sp.]|nr:hypothetical protein [Arachnia sp.]
PTSTPSGPTELRILAARLAEVIEPDQGDADDAKRLAREVAAAHRDRFLHLSPNFHGSMPWFTPPRHIDPARRPRQHQRHRLHQLTPGVAAPPCPPDPDPPDLEDLIRRSATIWGNVDA